MTRMDSFTRVENELLPKFRNMINQSESTEDVKKFFVYCMQDLFAQVFEGRLVVRFEEVALSPDATPPFTLDAALQGQEEFVRLWQRSEEHTSELQSPSFTNPISYEIGIAHV